MRTIVAGALGLLVAASSGGELRAQHEGQHQHQHQHQHQQPAQPEQPAQHQQHETQHGQHQGPVLAAQPGPRPLARFEVGRIVSGTAWQPPNTPHAAFHTRAAGWDLMAHAVLFGGYDWQGGDRGADALTAVGWFMGMADRQIGAGVLTARVMLSPELLTVRDGGYPLLLQTGESYEGQPLHDRQHPHDLLMEAALMHTHAVTPGLGLQVYAALAGEPALGPPGFPHRQSASADPLALLGHHWQDSTHITFGVLTAGLVTRLFKLEGSWFNGREPDEDRHDVELRRPDAFAGRLSLNPSPDWVAQVSYGYLPSPHALDPDHDLTRVTASVTHHRTCGAAGHWASTAAFGANGGHHGSSRAVLLESTWDLDGANVVFGRGEYVGKSGHELALDPADHQRSFGVGSLVLGYLRNFPAVAGLRAGLGLRAAGNLVPATLERYYGTRTPVGGMVYLRLAVAALTVH